MKRITLLSCLELEGYVHDDHLLVAELEKQGHAVATKPWENFKDEGEDLFIIRTTWNYTDHINEFLECLEPIKDRLLNPLPLIKWNSNKNYLVELQENGVDVMPLHLAKDKETLNQALEKLGGNDFIAKHLISASAKGLIKFDKSNLPDLEQEMIIQKFYPQITEGEISLIFFNGEYAYAVKKTPKPGDIRVQEEYGGIITPHTPSKEESKLAHKAVAQIPKPWLYARVDIVPGIGLIELECIEPSLYFSKSECGAKLFTEAISSSLYALNHIS